RIILPFSSSSPPGPQQDFGPVLVSAQRLGVLLMPGVSGLSASLALRIRRSSSTQMYPVPPLVRNALRFALILPLLLCAGSAVFAQGNGEVTDVHITPRVNPDAATR